MKVLLLFIWFIFPFLSLASFGLVIFPRFILFMVIPLFIIGGKVLSGFCVFSAKKMKPLLIIPLILVIYPIYVSVIISTNPLYAQIPKADRNQFFDDWPSGWGVKSVIDYLRVKSKEQKIVIGTEGTFGLNPAVYEMYFGTDPNVEIHGFWPVNEVPKELLEKAKRYPTYLIFKEKQDIPASWPLKLIAKYKRGLGKILINDLHQEEKIDTYLYFFQVEGKQ